MGYLPYKSAYFLDKSICLMPIVFLLFPWQNVRLSQNPRIAALVSRLECSYRQGFWADARSSILVSRRQQKWECWELGMGNTFRDWILNQSEYLIEHSVWQSLAIIRCFLASQRRYRNIPGLAPLSRWWAALRHTMPNKLHRFLWLRCANARCLWGIESHLLF